MTTFARVVCVGLLLAVLPHVHAKRCVFLHGAGETDVGPPTSSDTGKYWGGNLDDSIPACTSTTFNHDNTRDNAFDDKTLMQNYCDVASEGTGNIENAIVFTHSMGNNIMAKALQSGVCTMDVTTTNWYSVSSPGAGSMAANFVEHICANSSVPEVLRKAAELLHYCREDDPTRAAEAYISCMFATYAYH